MTIKDKIRTKQYIIDPETNRISFTDLRFYWDEFSNDFYPSVTTVLGMAWPKDHYFYEWLKANGENADQIRDAAGTQGSIVHQATEVLDVGGRIAYLDDYNTPKYSTNEWKMIERYIDFKRRFKTQMKHIEVNLVSSTYKVGGTLDRVMYMEFKDKKKGSVIKRLLMDIKTSQNLHDQYWIQLSVYVKMWEELYPNEKIDGICILWLNAKTRTNGKDGDIQGKGWQLVFPDEGIDDYFNDWLNVKAIFDRKFKDMKPNNLEYDLFFETKAEDQINLEELYEKQLVIA